MKIRGFLDTTFVDWEGKVASTIFLSGCDFRCPFCYNVDLVLESKDLPEISKEKIFSYLKENKDFIDGVVIIGGEPTMHEDLPKLCKDIKDLGMGVKIDTNGTNPKMLRDLIENKLVDYVTMDVKAPLDIGNYSKSAGVKVTKEILDKVKESVNILLGSDIGYEFCTTVVPALHSDKDIEEIAKSLKGAKLHVLQKYEALPSLDPKFKGGKHQSDEEMERLAKLVKKHLQNVKWRGK